MLVKAVPLPELREAYRAEQCPVCALNDRDERRYVDTMLYDQVTNVTWRAHVRNARGFCAPHTTRMLHEGRSALGVALIAEDLIKTLQDTLGAKTTESAWNRLRGALGSAGSALAQRMRGPEPCPLCAHLRQQTPVHLRSLLQDIATREGQAAYEVSTGLCVPHLAGALEGGEPAEGIAPLIVHQQAVWQHLLGQLQEFIRKSDYQFTGEPIGDERDAWRRAFRLLAGWQAGQDLRKG